MNASENKTGINATLDNLVGEKKVPGIAVTFFKEGQPANELAAGYASVECGLKALPHTVFRIASASKPIAATALARLVEKGTIDLDASFYDYVPYFPKKKYDFSIRKLAGHTAGIRSYRGKEYALNKPYTINESISIFQDDPLIFKPGTSFHYNSFDWVLVSLAMEEASGIPFEILVKKEVLDPLGMESTRAEVPSEKVEHKAEFYTRYAKGFKKAVAVDNRFKLAGGGYLSTTSDLIKLGQSYLHAGLMRSDISKDFLTNQTIDGTPTYYGLGWEVSSDQQGRPRFGHTGISVGAYSNFYIYPDQEAVIAILINCTDPKIQTELDLLSDQLLSVAS